MMRGLQSNQWLGMSTGHFLLLSNLCYMINNTIEDAVSRFNARSFVSLDVPTKPKFEVEVNKTLNQTKGDLIINFQLLINISHLWTLIDEPFKVTYISDEEYPMVFEFIVTTNESNIQQMPQVLG